MKEHSGRKCIQNERWEITNCKFYLLCTGLSHFLVLHFLVLLRYCIFYKLMVCGNIARTKLISTICPTAFANFLSLCHILVIQYFKCFHYYYYIVMVIWDQCSFLLPIVSVLCTTDHAHTK